MLRYPVVPWRSHQPPPRNPAGHRVQAPRAGSLTWRRRPRRPDRVLLRSWSVCRTCAGSLFSASVGMSGPTPSCPSPVASARSCGPPSCPLAAVSHRQQIAAANPCRVSARSFCNRLSGTAVDAAAGRAGSSPWSLPGRGNAPGRCRPGWAASGRPGCWPSRSVALPQAAGLSRDRAQSNERSAGSPVA